MGQRSKNHDLHEVFLLKNPRLLVIAADLTLCVFGRSVIAVIAATLFPLWPAEMRVGVYYLSVAAGCFVASILLLAVGKYKCFKKNTSLPVRRSFAKTFFNFFVKICIGNYCPLSSLTVTDHCFHGQFWGFLDQN